MRTLGTCLVVIAMLGCSDTEPAKGAGSAAQPAAPKVAPPSRVAADNCKVCHAAIVKEWSSSMHAHSTADADPIYAVLRKKAIETMGDKGVKRCNGCHYAEWSAKAEAEGGKAVGVTCNVCHEIPATHPEGVLASGKAGAFARQTEGEEGAQGLCLSCHAELKTGKGIPVCTTGHESKMAKAERCIDCHMVMAEGPGTSTDSKATTHRAHRFEGGHSPNFLAGAATISLRIDGGEVVATVRHVRAGHSIPTGNPLRFLVARVEQLDAEGQVVHSNIEGYASPPLHSGAVFMRVFSSKDGKKPVPPFLSEGEPEDSRLEFRGKRELRVARAKGATKARAKLEYYLAPRTITHAAKMSGEPAIMHSAELSLEGK